MHIRVIRDEEFIKEAKSMNESVSSLVSKLIMNRKRITEYKDLCELSYDDSTDKTS